MHFAPHRRAVSGHFVPEPVRETFKLGEEDRRAILGAADELVGRAGRSTLMMALRGSRAKRVRQFAADQARGHGYYASRTEAEVLVRIDALVAEGLLRIESHDGFPLLGYTPRGLEMAMQFAAEAWLVVLRSRVRPVAAGAALELPFLATVLPQRNPDTVLLLADLAAREADPTWLPLLQAWQAAETRRVRARLAPIIAGLVATQTK